MGRVCGLTVTNNIIISALLSFRGCENYVKMYTSR